MIGVVEVVEALFSKSISLLGLAKSFLKLFECKAVHYKVGETYLGMADTMDNWWHIGGFLC